MDQPTNVDKLITSNYIIAINNMVVQINGQLANLQMALAQGAITPDSAVKTVDSLMDCMATLVTSSYAEISEEEQKRIGLIDGNGKFVGAQGCKYSPNSRYNPVGIELNITPFRSASLLISRLLNVKNTLEIKTNKSNANE